MSGCFLSIKNGMFLLPASGAGVAREVNPRMILAFVALQLGSPLFFSSWPVL
jgi:hypothetical protein